MEKESAPTEEALRRVLSEVVDGYTKIVVDKKDVFVKHFASEDQYLLESNYKTVFETARAKGLPTEQESLDLLIKEDIWSEQEEGELIELGNYLENLKNTKKNLIIPSQIEGIKKDISDAEEKINNLKGKRNSLITSTCESYATNKNNDFSIYLSFFKDPECKVKYLDWEEFCEVPKAELQVMFAEYIKGIDHLSIRNIKYLSISNVFSIYYNILGKDNLYKFFDVKPYYLTYYQLNLLNYAKILNSILENVEKIPEEIKQDPEELLSFAESSRKNKSVQQKSQNKQGFSVVGATNKDMQQMGVANEFDVSPFDLAKEKGTLTIEDFQKFS